MKNMKGSSANRKDTATLSLAPTRKKYMLDSIQIFNNNKKATIEKIYITNELLNPNLKLKS